MPLSPSPRLSKPRDPRKNGDRGARLLREGLRGGGGVVEEAAEFVLDCEAVDIGVADPQLLAEQLTMVHDGITARRGAGPIRSGTRASDCDDPDPGGTAVR